MRSQSDILFRFGEYVLSWRCKPATRRQAQIALFEHINGFYNPSWRHSARNENNFTPIARIEGMVPS